MLSAQRKTLLLERLRVDGRLVAKDVAVELGISEDSIRRDLRELAAAGLCQRVYGGALPTSPAVADYATRQQVEPDSKRRVAQRAAQLVESGMSIILDGGTTTLALVGALPDTFACTVITHSPTIATALLAHPGIEVLIIGGKLYKHSAVACGAAAVEAAQAYKADLFFLGVTGVHPGAGLTTGDADEAAMKRALAARAADTWALASVEKMGAASPYLVLPTTQVSGIITDSPATSPVVTELLNQGVTVHIT
ncbi:DeoR/GlpR family DNA-binding transcription regulator [Micromonosporaceae bacterium Da 78-11]